MGKVKIFPSDREWSNYVRTRDQWTCNDVISNINPLQVLCIVHIFGVGEIGVSDMMTIIVKHCVMGVIVI